MSSANADFVFWAFARIRNVAADASFLLGQQGDPESDLYPLLASVNGVDFRRAFAVWGSDGAFRIWIPLLGG